MMENDELFAMIPVNEKWATEEMEWEHPAEKLLERLEEKTKGRIIRTDGIPSGSEELKKPRGIGRKEWKDFTDRLKWNKNGLWIQYTIRE